MLIVRYQQTGSDADPEIGVVTDAGLHRIPLSSMSALLRQPVDAIRAIVESAAVTEPIDVAVRLLAPVDGRTEIWAAGVTYRDSRDARVEESERASTVYTEVYGAPRPEIFLKCAAWRARGSEELVRVRADGGVSVPEPELAVIGNTSGEIVGFTVCNDVSSRSIEAANPLYLPQAKIYDGSCAIGPGIRPAWEVPDPYRLTISATIERGGHELWTASTSSSMLNRRIDELIEWLTRETSFPEGFALSTGTGIVPDWPITIEPGDRITVDITDVGTLKNTVAAA